MRTTFTRREALQSALLATGALGLPALLAACGGDDDDASATTIGGGATTVAGSTPTAGTSESGGGSGGFGTAGVALSWIKDVTFAGSFLADDRGYYLDDGFSAVEFTAGGGNAPPPTAQLLNGDVLIAFSSAEAAASAALQGGDVRIVGTLFQKSPLALISLDAAPVATPQDMIGKRIGVYAGGEQTLEYFLTLNGLSVDDVTTVPTNYDPMVLASGEVDGYMGYSFDEPNTLAAAGYPAQAFLFADYGYLTLAQAYAVLGDDLENRRDELKAWFAAEIAGWRDNIADPAAGTDIVLTKYGADAGLDAEHQQLQNESQLPLITDGTDARGLLTISDELSSGTIAQLAAAGIDIAADQIIDLTLLAEVYAEHPELLSS